MPLKLAWTSLLGATTVSLLSAHLLLGISHIALLPPWEGFDEIKHYSYVQHLTDTGRLPRLGVALLSRDVEEYANRGPLPYGDVPLTDPPGRLTYREFFESSSERIAQGASLIHVRPAVSRRYQPGQGPNWGAQHPPLYYAVLAPVYAATRHLSWGAHLFSLRVVSYLFAWAALVVAVVSLSAHSRLAPVGNHATARAWGMLGVALWPLLIPSWFPEMARLGNDSLCALIMALLWWLTVRAASTSLSVSVASGCGLLLGMGWLTKALFVPVTAGLMAFWLVHGWRRARGQGVVRVLMPLGAMCLILAAIAGWWYVDTWSRHSAPPGSAELIQLREAGGMLSGLKRNFSLVQWVRGHAAFLTTFVWSGTSSLTRPPRLALVPLVLGILATAVAYLLTLRGRSAVRPEWVPVWILGPVLLGFSFHVVVRIGLTGEGIGTSGYYLHFLAAPVGVAMGLGLGGWWRGRRWRPVIMAWVAYAIVFAVGISWAQVMLFAGYLFKAGAEPVYQVPPALPQLGAIPSALERLGSLAYPQLGAVSWLGGAFLASLGVLGAWRAARALGSAALSE